MLMRSRFTAFAVGDVAHLQASWHPSTRPTTLDLDPDGSAIKAERFLTTIPRLVLAQAEKTPADAASPAPSERMSSLTSDMKLVSCCCCQRRLRVRSSASRSTDCECWVTVSMIFCALVLARSRISLERSLASASSCCDCALMSLSKSSAFAVMR